MISFSEVSFGYPQKDIFNKISFELLSGEHCALIGSNGTGKSTLLKLITDTDRYTYTGRIKKDYTGRTGYVSQFVAHRTDDLTVFDYLAEPFVALEKRSDELCAEMENAENLEELCEEYQQCLDELEAVDGYNYAVNIRKQLAVAGLAETEKLSVSSISGGEYKLISIIRNMLLKPQLLIMDEPDVFLDFENIIGLTRLINSYEGTLLAVTHSRLLLRQCFDKIMHIENEELREFPGTYAEYQQLMLEEKIDLKEHTAKFDDFIALQNKLIEEKREIAELNSDPRLGKQLRARVTYLDRIIKMRGRDPFLESRDIEFTLPQVECPEEKTAVLSISDYSLSYDDRKLLSEVNFEVEWGEKIAIVGANGTGKSSLLKHIYESLITKNEYPTEFFRQIYDNEDNGRLSGGEQNMKRIQELCDSDAQILILDEPTSHLDTRAQIALEKAVKRYAGTVIMVSHDFFAVTGCADRIIILENGTAREMSGRAYRKSIYKKYFSSDIFEQEMRRIDKEERVVSLLLEEKFAEARIALNS